MANQDKNVISKTPQELVHIQHNITARQYKYWFLLLKAYKDLSESGADKDSNGFYAISLANISSLMGYEPMKKELKADLEALRKEPIIINYLEKDKKPATHGMGFISEWKVTSTQVAFKLPSFVEKVLNGDLEAKQMFLLLNWNVFNSFSGKYEVIIYKLCKDYIGVGKTPYMDIAKFRAYIGLKNNEYTAIDNLKRRCITNPIKNINENDLCDILVTAHFEKQGVRVVGLYFKMKHKKKTPLLDVVSPEPNPVFKLSLIDIPYSKQLEYLSQFSESQIQIILERANEYIAKLKADEKDVNIGAIYRKAFLENWGLDKEQEPVELPQDEPVTADEPVTTTGADSQSCQSEQAQQEPPQPQETTAKIIENDYPPPKRKINVDKPDDIEMQTWHDFLGMRRKQKLPMNKSAWDIIYETIQATVAMTGLTADQIMKIWISREWRHFQQNFITNIQNQVNYDINKPTANRKCRTAEFASNLANSYANHHANATGTANPTEPTPNGAFSY